MNPIHRMFFVAAVAISTTTFQAQAVELPCSVCAGVRVATPPAADSGFNEGTVLGEEATFFMAMDIALDGTADLSALEAVRGAGSTPWLRAVFRTPLPVVENLGRLEHELEELAKLVREAGPGVYVQAVWQPEDGRPGPVDLAFLIKKAAVAVTGASVDAVFTAGPLEANPAFLESLYQKEVAAYLDLVTVAPGGDLAAAVATLTALDPGKPLVLDLYTEW